VAVKPFVLEKIAKGEYIKLDIGSGNKHEPGYLRLDKAEFVDPDILCDLEVDGIPLPDSSVDEVRMIAVLEHCRDVIPVLNEIWRVCKDGASVHIAVPHWSCDDHHGDPTHKSTFTEASASYWDKRSLHYTNTDYGVKCAFDVLATEIEYHPSFHSMPIPMQEVAANFWRNIKLRIHYRLRAVKE